MSAEHTPTPWSLGGKATIKATGPQGGPAYIATMENNCERAANAEFIVRAVNCHDDLVAALRLCRDHFSGDALRLIDAALAKAAQS